VTLSKDSDDWSLLNEQVLLLSKKHGQLKQAITKMVQVVMGFLDSTPKLEAKLSTIETLRTVTEGKIFVEVERARVTKILSDIKKEQGDLKAAKEILCELQVETFGSMERREKTEFILAQVALCIEEEDWTQAGILSRKISTKYLSRKPKKTEEQLEKEKKEREKKRAKGEDIPEPIEDDVTDLKLRYYEQQITLAKHDDKYLDACKHYRQVLDTEAVEEDPMKLHSVSTIFCCMDLSNFPRSSKESSTMSSSPPTTTDNPISSTAYKKIHGSIKSLSTHNSSNSSPFMSSCDGQKLLSCLVPTFAAQMCSMPRRANLQIRRHINDGRISASVSSSTMSASLPNTIPVSKCPV
jgi:hypothetical protein